jgi:HlyD family type I secretion membrane fusion protein
VPDDAVAAAVNRERSVFRNHRELLKAQLDGVDQRVPQTRAQEEGAKGQLQSAQRQLALAVQEQQAAADWEHVGLAPKHRLLELDRSVEALRGQAGQLLPDVARFGSQAVEFAAEKPRIRQAAQTDATTELREAQLRINDVLPRLAADRDTLQRPAIRAPISGQVVNLAIFTKGGVIEPGRPIMDIVPASATIVAKVRIRPQDVEYLHIGQAAQVVATGFNPRDTAPIRGEVAVVSADRIADAKTGQSYFEAEVALRKDRADGALLRRPGPGMPVEIIVPTKLRTVFDYLVGPLRESYRRAMREM